MKEALLITVPLGLLLWLYSSKTGDSALPRGIRNNNPSNIEFHPSVNWLGQVGSDGRFIVFESPHYGLRALGRVLLTYRNKYDIKTVRSVISRWAPPTENDTESYITHVANKLDISENAALGMGDYPSLMAAIIHHENGAQPYTSDEIQEGFDHAKS